MSHNTRDLDMKGLRAYLVEPERKSTGGMLVLPTIQGVDPLLKDICGRIADAGLTALAWDPFSAYPLDTPQEDKPKIAQSKLEDEPTRREQMHWVGYMEQELGLENVGTIGFCMGGRMCCTLCAADTRVKACVTYYASIRVPTPPPQELDAVALATEVRCPVQCMYPTRDHVTSNETFYALRQSLESRNAPSFVQFFPNADHGFLNPQHHDDPLNVEAFMQTLLL